MNPDPPDWDEFRRQRALQLKQNGWMAIDIAEALGIDVIAVRHWIKEGREADEEALKTEP